MLRLYRNPFKQSLYLLISLGFVAVGVLLLRDPKIGVARNMMVAYLAIGFFGLGSVFFLYSMARDLLVRHPMLQVHAQCWTYEPEFGRHSQHVPWQDIGRVALYRQRDRSNRMFYLVLEARNPDALPPSRARAVAARIYPSMSVAALTVPLNKAFVRTSPEKVEHLLHSIQAEFSSELYRYGITVDGTLQDM